MLQLNAALLEPLPYYGKVFCEKAWRWDTVGRPFENYDLWYVWSGEGELSLNGRRRSISKGCCYLFRPGDETEARHDVRNPITVTFIHFHMPAFTAAQLSPFRVVRDIATFEAYLSLYVRRLLAAPSEREEPGLLLYLLLLQLYREEASGKQALHGEGEGWPTLMQETAAYVRQFPSIPHTPQKLAERARLSPRYFSRRFKETMGQTVESYIISARIERAEHLLRFNGMNVSEVAEALGYNNIHYFSRQFKQYRGFSPSRLRER
ncbi:AraC family transcriptional regulator [Paenibacillus puerhi]|uniref:AraC family transcriptional regulator n=1 Tax=Paenibacillus puerhi TaxID=2692622 RepID=UPI001358A4CB|nr:AraC family transcriptional regulator [Paenibacillus puerhi]